MAGSRRGPGRHTVRSEGPALAAAFLAGLGALVVIRSTMLPTVGSWDTAEAQVVLPLMGTMHPTGFPAYVMLGWLASVVLGPLGSPAFLMNLLSALLVGVATGGTVLVSRRLGAPLPLAVAVGAGFAFTPVTWAIGNAADAHALHLALLVAVVLGLLGWERLVHLRRRHVDDPALCRRADRVLVVTAGVFGAAVANHALAVLLVPAIGLYVLSVDPLVVRRPRLILAALGACLGVAVLLYLELPLRAGPFRAPLVYGHPETWTGFWDVVLARQFQGDVVSPWTDIGGRVSALAGLAGEQLGLLAALVPAALLYTVVRHPRYALLSGVAAGITVLFAASYSNARIERYYLGPVFFAWTWLAAFAGGVVANVIPRPGDGPAPAAVADLPVHAPAWRDRRIALAILLGAVLLVPTAITLPDRWRELDRSGETWVETWVDEAFTAMEPGAVVVSWWSYSTPLWYGQLVEGRRPDVFILDDRTRLDLELGEVEDVLDAYLGLRPVYIMRANQGQLDALRDRYVIEPVGRPGNLYRVTGRQETTP